MEASGEKDPKIRGEMLDEALEILKGLFLARTLCL